MVISTTPIATGANGDPLPRANWMVKTSIMAPNISMMALPKRTRISIAIVANKLFVNTIKLSTNFDNTSESWQVTQASGATFDQRLV